MNIKTIFRSIFALVILIITLMLLWTCIVKTQEILQAPSVQAQKIHLQSTDQQEYRLWSNQKTTPPSVSIVIPNQSSIVQISCKYYEESLCTAQDDQNFYRKILTVDLARFNQHYYIENIAYLNTQDQQIQSFKFAEQQVKQFYQQDVDALKYQVFSLFLFSLIALYVCFRIIKNFQRFIKQ